MARHVHDSRHLEELMLQALQIELGTIEVITTAISTGSARHAREWAEALDETGAYRDVLVNVLVNLSVDPDTPTPGRRLAMHHRDSLVQAIEMAKLDGNPAAAQVVARECVALAEKIARQSRERIGLMLERSRKRMSARTREASGATGIDSISEAARSNGRLADAVFASPASRAA